MPKACKTQANKTLETSPTEPTKKKEKERKKIASRPSDIARNNSTIARYARLESRRHHLEIWLWKTVPKASNSSRIRGQGMQNTSQKNSRNVADGTHKNERIKIASSYSQVRSSGSAPKASRNLALENGSESLEQQQDSCPRHAKHKPIKLSKRRLRNPLKRKKRKEKR